MSHANNQQEEGNTAVQESSYERTQRQIKLAYSLGYDVGVDVGKKVRAADGREVPTMTRRTAAVAGWSARR